MAPTPSTAGVPASLAALVPMTSATGPSSSAASSLARLTDFAKAKVVFFSRKNIFLDSSLDFVLLFARFSTNHACGIFWKAKTEEKKKNKFECFAS
jgi:hypothetical protein